MLVASSVSGELSVSGNIPSMLVVSSVSGELSVSGNISSVFVASGALVGEY